ncbi:MAG TPA: hypothetical protein PKC08_04765 [Pseudomonadales bacterium]|nr:hypothetical protein [Pseudomonadales bacterium]
MEVLRLLRRNRLLLFGVVAMFALAVSTALVFDFRIGAIVTFLWQTVLMIGAIIVCAGVLFGLLLALRTLCGRGAK